jgi:hypothetical protein
MTPPPQQFERVDLFLRRHADDMAGHLLVGRALQRRQIGAIVKIFVKRRHSDERAREAPLHSNFCRHRFPPFFKLPIPKVPPRFTAPPGGGGA